MSPNPPVEAERTGQPFLLYRDGDDQERRYSLDPGAVHAVGRQASSDLVLDWDEQVSRLHAKLERTGEDWTVVDDGLSRNGTFVNGERLSGPRRLNDGDAVQFGATAMTYHSPRVGEEAGMAAGGDAPIAVDLSTSQHRVLAALCRPYEGGSVFGSPATDEQIAEELVLTVNAVRKHLAVLFAKFGVDDLPADQKRVRLVERAIHGGVISERDL